MKILKYLFLLLILAAIAITVFIATQNGRYDIRKERVIKVPKTVLFNYLNDYRNWENVGIVNSDTTMVYSFSKNTSGQGALMSWKKGSAEGKVQTKKLVANDSILQDATIDGLQSNIIWGFKDTLNSTKVTVRIKGELSFSDKAYAVLKGGVEDKLEASLEQGLQNLDNFLVHELNTYDINVNETVLSKRGVFYLGHSTVTKTGEVNRKISETFARLLSFTKTNNIATNGAPFVIYKSYNTQKDSAAYTICVPIKEEIFTTPGSEFEGGKLEAFNALKTTLKGDYSHLRKAWAKAFRHIEANALQENTSGQYVEVYTKGVWQTKKPSAWITDIFVPIGRPAVPAAPLNPVAAGTAQPIPAGTPARATNPVRTNSGTTANRTGTGTTTRPAGTANRPATGAPATTRPRTTTPPQTTTPAER